MLKLGSIKSVMSGGIWREDVGRASAECWTDKPQQSVNYVEAHDNLTLYDKLRSSMPEASGAEIIAADKLAAAIVFLSQGVPFIQAGPLRTAALSTTAIIPRTA